MRVYTIHDVINESGLKILVCSAGDFLTECPAQCRCKWSGGKKTADCSQQSYTTIPPNLHTDIQVDHTTQYTGLYIALQYCTVQLE